MNKLNASSAGMNRFKASSEEMNRLNASPEGTTRHNACLGSSGNRVSCPAVIDDSA